RWTLVDKVRALSAGSCETVAFRADARRRDTGAALGRSAPERRLVKRRLPPLPPTPRRFGAVRRYSPARLAPVCVAFECHANRRGGTPAAGVLPADASHASSKRRRTEALARDRGGRRRPSTSHDHSKATCCRVSVPPPRRRRGRGPRFPVARTSRGK